MTSIICLEVLKGLITLTAPIIAAIIALRLYFRQKEYELIKQRYLEGAVDVVSAELEQALGTFSHNWARSINIVKAFRDEKSHFDPTELHKGFLTFDSSRFHRIAHHRIGNLTGSQSIWRIYQIAMAFCLNANSKLTKEIPEAIRLKLTATEIASDENTIAAAMFAELQRIDDESHKFASLIRELHQLGLLLETERLNFRTLAKFSKRKEVREMEERLKADFAEDLGSDQPISVEHQS